MREQKVCLSFFYVFFSSKWFYMLIISTTYAPYFPPVSYRFKLVRCQYAVHGVMSLIIHFITLGWL